MYVSSVKSSCKRRILELAAVALVALVLLPIVSAHGEGEESDLGAAYTLDKGEAIKHGSINLILIASIIISILVGYAVLQKKAIHKSNTQKVVVFSILTAAAVGTTLYAAGSTVYLNIISETAGPVHWHADFEIWDCGNEIDPIDPTGLSNRVGTPTLHEHGDNRIHVEGVPIQKRDVNLHNFLHVIGGDLQKDYFTIPIDGGTEEESLILMHEMRTGELCGGERGVLQIFVYKVINPDERKRWVYEQVKLTDYENYIMSPYQNVPPGDCIIIEYDRDKESTDKLCETFEVAMGRGELSGS